MPWPSGMDRFEELRHAPQVLDKARYQSGGLLTLPFVYRCRGTKREQSNHRADLEARGAAVRQAKHVVVEAILLVPHAARTDSVHRAGDQQELQGVVRCQLLISRVVRRELERDLEHVL